jgi:hypothetical protein
MSPLANLYTFWGSTPENISTEHLLADMLPQLQTGA